MPMLDPTIKIYYHNCKHVSKCALAKVRPGEMYGDNKMGASISRT